MGVPVPRFLFFSVLILLLIIQCSEPNSVKHYLILHNIGETNTQRWFTSGLARTADSLGIILSILDQTSPLQKRAADSLLKNAAGVGFSTPIGQQTLQITKNQVSPPK